MSHCRGWKEAKKNRKKDRPGREGETKRLPDKTRRRQSDFLLIISAHNIKFIMKQQRGGEHCIQRRKELQKREGQANATPCRPHWRHGTCHERYCSGRIAALSEPGNRKEPGCARPNEGLKRASSEETKERNDKTTQRGKSDWSQPTHTKQPKDPKRERPSNQALGAWS